jgi:hypothetical protein
MPNKSCVCEASAARGSLGATGGNVVEEYVSCGSDAIINPMCGHRYDISDGGCGTTILDTDGRGATRKGGEAKREITHLAMLVWMVYGCITSSTDIESCVIEERSKNQLASTLFIGYSTGPVGNFTLICTNNNNLCNHS